ncbi:MAG: hypothetical protein KF712_07790 [Akkermansiaceae bacterium]|nr:hypothetical protein [Akkermansiaceae bacterium]
MKTHALVLSAVLAAFVSVEAQVTPPFQPKDDADPSKPSEEQSAVKGFWQARLAGGEYAVATERITSVSRHSYVLDGTVLVDEVTIDTTGQALARFYFLSPRSAKSGGTAAEQGKGFLDAGGQASGADEDHMVIKKYPDTTHAKTIEYRLGSEAELTKLFNSAKQAWQSGKGGQFSARIK